MGPIHLTQKGYEEKVKELERLKKVDRRNIAKEIGKARELGDLKENAEYHAAKDQQGLIEKRIAELENTLSQATIINEDDVRTDEVVIGTTVRIKDVGSGRDLTYSLVAPEEADIDQNKLSITSPVGSALMGSKINEIIEVKIPAGSTKYKIIKIAK
ncbi:MAG: transcription elongation factor GreA [Candidatus Omnitrophota bacterium]